MTATAVRSGPVELLGAAEALPSNPEWHKLRRAGVTASEIACVLGISPFDSPFSLYWKKREGWRTESTPEMEAGRRAEPVIVQWFADQHDEYTVRPPGLYANPDRPWQLATPDGLVYALCGDCDGGGYGGANAFPSHGDGCASCYATGLGSRLLALVEAKYPVGGWDGWGEPGTDDIPVHYRAQCLWQLDVMGVDEVYLAAWHGADFREYLIRRDERDLRVMRAAGLAFLDRLAAGTPPDIDGHTATIRALKTLHPSIEDVDIDVPAEFAEGYRRARALRQRADAIVDRYEARARHTLGNARRLVCNGHLVVSRSIYDQSSDMAEVDSLDTDAPTVDRLNPGRAANYLVPKAGKK